MKSEGGVLGPALEKAETGHGISNSLFRLPEGSVVRGRVIPTGEHWRSEAVLWASVFTSVKWDYNNSSFLSVYSDHLRCC